MNEVITIEYWHLLVMMSVWIYALIQMYNKGNDVGYDDGYVDGVNDLLLEMKQETESIIKERKSED